MTPAEQIRNSLSEAYNLAKKAHKNCYHDLDTGAPPNLYAVMSYAAACVSKYSAAEAIYWANPELEGDKLFEILQQFERVVKEARKYYEVRNNTTGFITELQHLEEILRG